MTTLKQVFSLEGLSFNQGLECAYVTLTLGVGKGKSRKGFAWGIEKTITNNLQGLVFVTSELNEGVINSFCNEYSKNGEYEAKEDLEVVFINTTTGDDNLEWLVDRLNYIKGQEKYALILDDVRLTEDVSIEDIINSLEESGSKFKHILATQQANNIQ